MYSDTATRAVVLMYSDYFYLCCRFIKYILTNVSHDAYTNTF